MDIVGFTGTRAGMTPEQEQGVRRVLRRLAPVDTVHHGDDAGADAQFHHIARERKHIRVEVHPPSDPKHRAWCEGDILHMPRPYLRRNHDIVDASQVLIATPNTSKRGAKVGDVGNHTLR